MLTKPEADGPQTGYGRRGPAVRPRRVRDGVGASDRDAPAPLLLEAQYGESAVFREQRKAFRWQLRVCETDHDHVGHRHPHEVK